MYNARRQCAVGGLKHPVADGAQHSHVVTPHQGRHPVDGSVERDEVFATQWVGEETGGQPPELGGNRVVWHRASQTQGKGRLITHALERRGPGDQSLAR